MKIFKTKLFNGKKVLRILLWCLISQILPAVEFEIKKISSDNFDYQDIVNIFK